ncbi:MAG: 2-oxoisovalerate dehydrogenase E1 component, beta subunit [bacterium]|nr:MAG: 2-oxoisovalerate dehydrogenase E1 component, beta subunit [bacterium]
MAVKTYIEALSDGLREEMHRDKNVYMLGEDIGQYGGAFKVTKGFLEEFGPERIVDTPLAESAIIGVAIGSAMMGMRPVAEMQFADFVACGFNQLINNAAKMHYRWGAAVPMVVRLPSGGGVRGGPFHSQNPEAWFCHTPGLKVVAPSTPNDAKGLIKSAIRDNNPVLYFEHKYLYRRIKEEVPDNDFSIPIGRGDIKRPGADVSIITYGSMVHASLEAAEKLAAEGIDVEVMDLRSLLPYDQEMIADTVKKSSRTSSRTWTRRSSASPPSMRRCPTARRSRTSSCPTPKRSPRRSAKSRRFEFESRIH